MTRPRGTVAFRAATLRSASPFSILPIALLVAYSFNASRLVAVWAGFSPRWYGALLADDSSATRR